MQFEWNFSAPKFAIIGLQQRKEIQFKMNSKDRNDNWFLHEHIEITPLKEKQIMSEQVEVIKRFSIDENEGVVTQILQVQVAQEDIKENDKKRLQLGVTYKIEQNDKQILSVQVTEESIKLNDRQKLQVQGIQKDKIQNDKQKQSRKINQNNQNKDSIIHSKFQTKEIKSKYMELKHKKAHSLMRLKQMKQIRNKKKVINDKIKPQLNSLNSSKVSRVQLSTYNSKKQKDSKILQRNRISNKNKNDSKYYSNKLKLNNSKLINNNKNKNKISNITEQNKKNKNISKNSRSNWSNNNTSKWIAPPCTFTTRIQREWQNKSRLKWYSLSKSALKKAQESMMKISKNSKIKEKSQNFKEIKFKKRS